uniref:(northern house mosquito) hypothetical protein n=1 Tax=Culex pipiens TaxID=7175 RepID=A0A8D8A9T4_CULPI
MVVMVMVQKHFRGRRRQTVMMMVQGRGRRRRRRHQVGCRIRKDGRVGLRRWDATAGQLVNRRSGRSRLVLERFERTVERVGKAEIRVGRVPCRHCWRRENNFINFTLELRTFH